MAEAARVLLVTVVLMLLVTTALAMYRWVDVDRRATCIGAGGAWDATDRQCTYSLDSG